MDWVELLNALRDVADVALVGLIFYRVLLLLNRTRAMQLLIGVLMILLANVGAGLLGLTTLSWLITNVSQYIVFALIVLLQPELRRLVSEIGQMPIFQMLRQPEGITYEPIVDAVKAMANKRIGSIICILQSIKPESIIENAVRVDGMVSSELLQTIFHKDTALHDGAVLIEGNRIIAASCYLPLSNSRALKRTHGARHRAAMGISEETDALILVTSEETGRISVMLRGEIETPVKGSELNNIMHRILIRGQTRLSQLDEEEAAPSRKKK